VLVPADQILLVGLDADALQGAAFATATGYTSAVTQHLRLEDNWPAAPTRPNGPTVPPDTGWRCWTPAPIAKATAAASASGSRTTPGTSWTEPAPRQSATSTSPWRRPNGATNRCAHYPPSPPVAPSGWTGRSPHSTTWTSCSTARRGREPARCSALTSKSRPSRCSSRNSATASGSSTWRRAMVTRRTTTLKRLYSLQKATSADNAKVNRGYPQRGDPV
jgi:hypothetical protein